MENQTSFFNDTSFFNITSLLDDMSFLDQQFFSGYVRDMIFKINGGTLLVLAAAGIPTNVLNMKIFCKLGLASSINIIFVSLSATDFICACIFAVLAVIMLDKSGAIDIGADLTDLSYPLGTVMVSSSALGSWLTALISAERCCGVAFPLKVKKIFTKKITIALIAAMLLTQIAAILTSLAMFNFSAITPPNSTRPLVVVGFDRTSLLFVNFAAVSVPSLVSFCLIFGNTIYLSIALNQKSKWAQQAQHQGQRHPAITRNRKVVVTVVSISAIYIACFLPGVILGIFYLLTSERVVESDQKDFELALASFFINMQAMSGASNFWVYFRKNSGYKQHLKTMLWTSQV